MRHLVSKPLGRNTYLYALAAGIASGTCSNAAYASCWQAAAERYGIEPALLKAIAWQESRGRVDAVGPKLLDGNRALGLMQINSIHLPTLARYGIRREHLFNACVSQQVGAWILADCINRFGATWKSIGCYYAGPASKNTAAQIKYVLDVQRFYQGYKRQEQHARPNSVNSYAAAAQRE
jgi:soluble lytic murein transglycosylase-like protein